jgi:NADPH2 dehydrogenase
LTPFDDDDATQGQPRSRNQAPHLLTKSEIAEYVQLYVTASRNAVERAGFDGVETHDANGYILRVGQFVKEMSYN